MCVCVCACSKQVEKEKRELARQYGMVRSEVSGGEIAEELEKERRSFQLSMCEVSESASSFSFTFTFLVLLLLLLPHPPLSPHASLPPPAAPQLL